MLKTTPSHQSALSLIEILVAVTLISFVLIALASNIFYTQRVIIDARLRAKAVDQANSCLERWRTARDGMLWWQFCRRLKCHCAKGSNDYTYPHSRWADEIKCDYPYQLPAYDILNRPAGLYAEKPVLDFFADKTEWGRQTRGNVNDTICGQPKPNITDNPNLKLGYHGQYQVHLKFMSGSGTAQEVTVVVTVQYQDYKGNNKQVQVAQKFSQDIKNELPYDGSCPTPP